MFDVFLNQILLFYCILLFARICFICFVERIMVFSI